METAQATAKAMSLIMNYPNPHPAMRQHIHEEKWENVCFRKGVILCAPAAIIQNP
jgi:hypothetical protein